MRALLLVIALLISGSPAGAPLAIPHYQRPPAVPLVDPMSLLPIDVQAHFECIAWTESRGKLVDTNPASNAQGLYQFLPGIWQFARKNIPGLPATPNQASRYQQDVVAVWYYQRNGGFSPEWSYRCV